MGFTLRAVKGEDFVDREEILDEMLTILTDLKSSTGFALYGSRRMGKTSIFKELQRQLSKKKGIICIYFSLWDLVEETLPEFITELSAAILDGFAGKVSLGIRARNLIRSPISLLKEIVRGLKVELKIQDEIELLLSFDQSGRIEASQLVEKTFDLAEKLALDTNSKCILLVDEFPSIVNLRNGKRIGEGILRKIRTIYEDYKNTVLCISGSFRSTMEMAVLKETSAFYRQFIVRKIGPFTPEATRKLILKNLKKDISQEALISIFQSTGGIPFYIQFLGRELERPLPKKINSQIVGQAVEEFLKEEGEVLFKGEFEGYSSKERRILATMAKEGLNNPSRIAEVLKEKPNTVVKILGYLEIKGVLTKEQRGVFNFVDFMFERWLRIIH